MPLRPHDRLSLGYIAATGVLVAVARKADFPLWGAFLALHAFLFWAVWILARSGGNTFPDRPFLARLCRLARDFYPLALVPALYKELFFLIPAIHPVDRDGWLIAADRLLFGEVPAVSLQAWLWPPAVEFFQWAYTSYFLIAASLAFLVYRSQDRTRFEELLFAVLGVYYASYAGYFLVPAVGPARTLIAHFPTPVEGLWATDFLREWTERLEWLQRDLFPSGHTAVSFLCILYAFRQGRGWGLAYAVVASSLIFSTVYCRYHYAVDVLAGILLALAGYGIARRWFRARKKGPAEAKAPTGPPGTIRPTA